MTDITQTPQFHQWFTGSKVVDQTGRPLILYRGIRGEHASTADRMLPRSNYAMFFSNNPHVAATYSGPHDSKSIFHDMSSNIGTIFPVYVKATNLKEFPIRVDRYGHRHFDKFEFDRQAKLLGPGQGLVARGVYDAGPMASTIADPEKRFSYASDTYSFGPGTSIKSAYGNINFNPDDPRMVEHIINKSRGFTMTKTFREILAERDDEFNYFVRSTANIHDPEIFERIRFAFLPYVVKSIDTDSYKPMSKENRAFPGEPNSPTYTVKVVTGLPIPKNFVDALALDARIHVAHLRIDPEGDLELVGQPGEIPKNDAQMFVGQKRIGEFIKELQADRKKREKMTATREVYESFFTTHRGLEDVIKKPVRNGYYMIETFCEDGNTYLKAEGPFATRPVGNYYRDRLRVSKPQVIAEGTSGGMYGVQVLIEDIK